MANWVIQYNLDGIDVDYEVIFDPVFQWYTRVDFMAGLWRI
jgi:hypothetical protein